jgi:hypothetical protein
MASVIKVVLAGDSKSLRAAIDSGSLSLSKLSAKSRESINSFAKWGAAGTVAGAAIIAGVVNSSRKSIDILAKQSDQIGISTENLAAFQHLAELTGVSSGSATTSIERMAKRLGEAASGAGAAKKTLDQLNLSASDLIKLSPDESYRKIGAAIRELGTQSEKAAATAAIFGREGIALLNTIEAGDEAFVRAAQDVAAFGTAISRVDAAKVEEFNDSFARVQEVIKGIGIRLTVELAPVLKVVSDRFVDAARESGGFTDQIVSGINLTIEAVAFLADTIRGLQVVWKLAEVAAMGFISLTLTGLDELQQAAAGALSWIPGVDIAPSAALSEWAEESRQALMMTNKELGELIDKPMPSTQVKQFFDTVKKEAQSSAEEIALIKKAILEPTDEGEVAISDEKSQKIIEAQAKKFESLKAMAERAALEDEERETLRHNRLITRIEDERALLEENGIQDIEAQAVLDEAEMNAHVVHLANMNALEETSQQSRKAFISANLDEAAALLMQGNGKIFQIGKKLALSQAAISLPSAVIQSFEKGGGFPLGLIPAGLMAARGAIEISKIRKQQAHSGLDRNPSEGTFLLKRNEMVLDSGTSKEVRQAAKSAATGNNVGSPSIVIETIEMKTTLTQDNQKRWMQDELIPGLFEAVRRGLPFPFEKKEAF